MLSNIPVIYEDKWLLIVDKPAGLLTIPAPGKTLRTLEYILNEDLKGKNINDFVLHPCHRLDQETSGLIIFAKGKSAQQAMMDVFRRREVEKTYIAFVHGLPRQDSYTINSTISGMPALTKVKVLERKKDFSIVEVYPKTGRKNQIRIHLRNIGHPLVGEDKFIFRKDYNLRAKRVCLHARALEFKHPFTHKNVSVSCELAKDLIKFLQVH